MSELQKFDPIAANITIIKNKISAIQIKSAEDQIALTALGKDVSSNLKQAEKMLKDIFEPYETKKKQFKEHFKNVIETPCEAIIKEAKDKLLVWSRELEKIRLEELKKAEEARKLAEAEAKKLADQERENAEFERSIGLAEQAAVSEVTAEIVESRELKTAEKEFKTEVKSINQMKVKGVKKIWKLKIVDASKVPATYLVVNEVKLRSDLMALSSDELRSAFKVDGVEFYQEESLSL